MEQTMVETLKNESIESLLLMAVLAQGVAKQSAQRELRRRKALRSEADFENLYMTNFGVVAF